MKTSYTNDNAADWGRRYQGCYGWVIHPDTKVETPVKVDHVTERLVEFSGLDGAPFHTEINKGLEFSFASLRKQIYQGVNGHLYVVQRVPARQWRRGIHHENTQIFVLTNCGPERVAVDRKTLTQLMCYNSEAMNKGTVFLNAQFGIVDNLLYLYENMIGTVEGKKITLGKEWRQYFQEVSDAVRDAGNKYEVSNA